MEMYLVNYTDIETDNYKILEVREEGTIFKEPEFFETEKEAIETANKKLPKGTKFYVFAEINELHISGD